MHLMLSLVTMILMARLIIVNPIVNWFLRFHRFQSTYSINGSILSIVPIVPTPPKVPIVPSFHRSNGSNPKGAKVHWTMYC